ncbi:MAG: twin-arginine translocation signal domain-containing protein [Acidimicrobiales bacterium]
MQSLNRRAFLKQSSIAVVAAGMVAAMPAASSMAGALEADAPAADSAGADIGTAAGAGGPLVAHVRDLASGEISLFSGTREVTLRDPQLARQLYRSLAR